MSNARRIGKLAALLMAVILLCDSSSGSVNGVGGGAVGAWSHQQRFNRFARHNYYNRGSGDGGGGGGGGGGGVINDLDEFNALYGLANEANLAAVAANQQQQQLQLQQLQQQQQQQPPEVYGIVEPLIEDLPCVDRPCTANDDCCPAGVCVNTYGEGKCIYVYGRKRDLCHRNLDCEPGSACLRASGGNLMCQPLPPAALRAMHQQQQQMQLQQQQQQQQQQQLQQQQQQLTNALGVLTNIGMGSDAIGGGVSTNLFGYRQFGDECESSRDCNVAKGMCCQLQRGGGGGGGTNAGHQLQHHHSQQQAQQQQLQRERGALLMPKRVCTYFHDPFMCIDIMPTENEDLRETRLLSAFRKRRY